MYQNVIVVEAFYTCQHLEVSAGEAALLLGLFILPKTADVIENFRIRWHPGAKNILLS